MTFLCTVTRGYGLRGRIFKFKGSGLKVDLLLHFDSFVREMIRRSRVKNQWLPLQQEGSCACTPSHPGLPFQIPPID
jgi:hypothetical protein